MKSITMIIAIMLIASTALVAQGHGMGNNCGEMNHKQGHHNFQGRGMKGGHGDGMGFALKELNLSEDQQSKIDALNLNHKKEMIDLKADLKKMELEKHSAMKDANFDKAKSVTEKIFDKKAEIAKKRISLHESIYKILTPEQREAAKKLHANRPAAGSRGRMQKARN